VPNYDEFFAGTKPKQKDEYQEFTSGCNLPVVEIKEKPKEKNLWCLCDLTDGELPKVQAFSKLTDLLSAFEAKENTDSFVWIFYGQPLQFTKLMKPQSGKAYRYLLLPDDKAVTVNSQQLVIDQSLLDIESQVEVSGWMGNSNLNTKQLFVEGYTDE
jgi:hypothetical protein